MILNLLNAYPKLFLLQSHVDIFFYNSRIYKAAVLTKTKTHTCEIKLLTEDKKSSLSYEI